MLRDRLRQEFTERRTKAAEPRARIKPPLVVAEPSSIVRTLLVLRTNPGVGLKRLAELTGRASKGHESERVQLLVKRGLVEPRPSYSQKSIRLTPKGLELARHIILQRSGLAP